MVYRRRRNELIYRFGVGKLIEKPLRQPSLGERMGCELVASLLHAPSVLFLDEPTIGPTRCGAPPGPQPARGFRGAPG